MELQRAIGMQLHCLCKAWSKGMHQRTDHAMWLHNYHQQLHLSLRLEKQKTSWCMPYERSPSTYRNKLAISDDAAIYHACMLQVCQSHFYSKMHLHVCIHHWMTTILNFIASCCAALQFSMHDRSENMRVIRTSSSSIFCIDIHCLINCQVKTHRVKIYANQHF